MSSSFLRSVSSKSQPICVWDLPSRDTNNLLSTVAMRIQTQRKLEEGLTKLSTALLTRYSRLQLRQTLLLRLPVVHSLVRRASRDLSCGQARKLLFLLHNSQDEVYHRSKSCQTHTDRKHSCCNYGHRHIHTTEIEADAS